MHTTSLKKIEKLIFNIEEKGCILLEIILFFLLLIGVIMRYFFCYPLTGVDELASWLFVWFSFLGISNLLGRNEHASVDFLVKKLPTKNIKFLTGIFSKIIIIFTLILILYFGMPIATKMMTIYWGNLPIPKGCAVLAIPISIAFMIIHVVISILYSIIEKKEFSIED